ncbi:MAG: heavy metal translocating P-type ATPase, partial [Bacillota bacterium]|nr:heavy metal translocating P-type ATPase [Bacillota bacterium]
ISRILQLVEEASAKKAPAERFITRFARAYTPVMVGLALVIAFLPPLILQQPLTDWIYRALILLVISCPCALVLSIPLGYFAGIGRASASGILVKGGQYLDRLAAIKTMAWDKTGTLTSGSYAVKRILTREPGDERAILEWAALAEHGSSHPLARSIVKAWQEKGGAPPDANRIRSADHLPGLGLSANIDGHRILLGNLRLLQENKISTDSLTAALQIENPELPVERLGTILYLAIDGMCAGVLELTDELRPEAVEAIRQLRKLGISEHILLSGDQPDRVASIAAQAGFDDYRGGLLPEQKVAALEELIASGKSQQPIAYVGDGINDTPILARADLSVALGGGSDAALENADIVIIGDDLSKLPPAVRLARKTGRIVRQNIAIALGFKILIVVLAVFGFSGIWQAVFADVGVALIAVLNALRILRRDRAAVPAVIS